MGVTAEADLSICYVRKALWTSIKENLKKGEAIKDEALKEVLDYENCEDEEMMVPIGQPAIKDEDLEWIDDDVIKKHGAKIIAEAFLQGEEKFEEAKKTMPADECPQEATAEDVRVMNEEGEESEEDDEDLDEEDWDEDEEEEDDGEEAEEEEAEAEEPPAKKAKKA
eukprot:gnl/TRDRNA2_/TRDRNA2_178225_c0_seq1.p1 gnl/TRDRNA2_/TRDRNA2_178225_c0~~gnl/TRDRNA2_/TRDRNA2_178225_c0_seq1.p1  ORF type:complete len:167 (-),score=79.38 gnl/TRDRNA2_/TRDRNA2_178225_c0_seq1:252-752(-)